MLTLDLLPLKGKKNLLAFSAGVDSSALFFLLLENDIKFDIAIVNYGTREESDTEEAHAKALAKEHKLFCHSIKAPVFHSHFEKQARDFRYEFFESLITIEGYDTLITAHQLNDQLEWLLMRLSKGAGLSELLGLEPVTHKRDYALIRPLLAYSKEELLRYLQSNKYPYFVDESNVDESYERHPIPGNQFAENSYRVVEVCVV
jgi:tRNA(Ile)-lysidine synthase